MDKLAASIYITLDSIVLKSGDLISFEAKVISNKPWFQIIHDSPFNTSSYYDGPDFERACEIYQELLLAFKGATRAEQLTRMISPFKEKIERMMNEKIKFSNEDLYNRLKINPLFLGVNDF